MKVKSDESECRIRLIGVALRTLIVVACLMLTGQSVDAEPPKDLSKWRRLDGSGFTIFSDAGDSRVRTVARDFMTFRDVLEIVFPALDQEQVRPIYMYAFRNEKSFLPFQAGGQGSAGFYSRWEDADYIGVRMDATDASAIVRHEYVHYVLSNNFPYMPVWLNEGLAHYLETFELSGSNGHIGLGNKSCLSWLGLYGLRFPLADLLDVTFSSEVYLDQHNTMHFRTGVWALVHYLFSPEEGRLEKTANMLTLLNAGEPSDRALTKAFGMTLEELQNEVRRYIESPSLRYSIVPASRAASGATLAVHRMERTETLCRLGHLLVRESVDNAIEAESYFKEAMVTADHRASAVLGKALTYIRRNDDGEALPLLKQVIGLEPANAYAHYLLGNLYVREFEKGGGQIPRRGESTPELVIKARNAFHAALQANPLFAGASNNYGHTYIYDAESQEPGMVEVAAALQRQPDLHLVMTLVELYSRAGHRDTALLIRKQHVDRIMRSLGPHSGYDPAKVDAAMLGAEILTAHAWASEGRFREAIGLLEEVLAQSVNEEVAGRAKEMLSSCREALAGESPGVDSE